MTQKSRPWQLTPTSVMQLIASKGTHAGSHMSDKNIQGCAAIDIVSYTRQWPINNYSVAGEYTVNGISHRAIASCSTNSLASSRVMLRMELTFWLLKRTP